MRNRRISKFYEFNSRILLVLRARGEDCGVNTTHFALLFAMLVTKHIAQHCTILIHSVFPEKIILFRMWIVDEKILISVSMSDDLITFTWQFFISLLRINDKSELQMKEKFINSWRSSQWQSTMKVMKNLTKYYYFLFE